MADDNATASPISPKAAISSGLHARVAEYLGLNSDNLNAFFNRLLDKQKAYALLFPALHLAMQT